MRVLVTGAGGPAGRSLLSQLAERGISAIGVDMEPVTDVPAERIYRVPAAVDPAMMPALREITEREGVTLIIPTVSEELPHLAAASHQFGAGVAVCVADPGPVAVAHDKLRTAVWLRARGVPVPSFATPEDYRSTAAAFMALGGPLVVKPRISRGGRGVRLADHADQLAWATVGPGDLVQRFLPGTEYAAAAYLGRPGADEAPLVAVLEKIELAAGRVGNGVTVRRLLDGEADDVAAVAVAAVAALGLHGPVDVDVRRDVDGVARVLEVNARFGAHSASVPELLDRVLVATARYQSAAVSAAPPTAPRV